MMAFNFPSSPSKGQKYLSYVWDGEKWTSVSGVVAAGAPASSAVPIVDGIAAPGVLNAYARGDHRHPADSSRAPLNAPNFTGTVNAAAVNVTGNAAAASVSIATSATFNTGNVGGISTFSGGVSATSLNVTGNVTLGNVSMNNMFLAAVNSRIVLGVGNAASTCYIDFHSSGFNRDYDARLQGYGGGSSNFQGAIQFVCSMVVGPTPAPGDNSQRLATTAFVRGRIGGGAYLPLSGGTVTGNMYINGDLRASRGDGTGVIFLNAAANRYLYWDNSNYNMPGSYLYTASGRIWGGNDFGLPISNGRLAYVGDWNQPSGAGLGEPWGYAPFTGIGRGPQDITFRGRAMQILTNGWYNVGTA